MNQRIRYIKFDGGYKSMRMLKNYHGIEYRPFLADDMLSGRIEDAQGITEVIVTGSSHHKTKIALKKALESLGVEFIPEGRAKKKEDTDDN